MRAATTTIDPWPLAARISGAIGYSPNTWEVVSAARGGERAAADALRVELESLCDGPIRSVPVHTSEDWLAAVKVDNDDVLLLLLESPWRDEDWRALDMQRSRLRREGVTILIADNDAVAKMVTSAPNLWSWIAGKVWALRGSADRGAVQ